MAQIERGRFADPSEAVFLIVGNFIDMEPHPDLQNELLRRMMAASAAELNAARPAVEVLDKLEGRLLKPRPEPARREKIAR